MTIDEAIKILQKDIDSPGSAEFGDVKEAEGLGIEALKRQKDERDTIPSSIYNPLPGETKD